MPAALAFGGCAAPPPVTADDRTGGRTLELLVCTPDDRAMRYRVEPDGTFRFGGGVEAVAGEFTWSTDLSRERLEAVLAWLDGRRWDEGPPPASGVPAALRQSVELTGPAGEHRFDLLGACPQLDELRALLDEIAARRFDRELDALPKAGDKIR